MASSRQNHRRINGDNSAKASAAAAAGENILMRRHRDVVAHRQSMA